MVKSSKTQFYVLLAITLAAIAVTLILLFVPEPKPVTITEKFYIVEDNCELHGKIKNNNGKEITIDRIVIYVHIKSPLTDREYDSESRITEHLTLQANEEYEINEQLAHLDGDTIKITSISAYVDGSEGGYTLYGNIVNDGKFAIAAVFTGIVGVAFLIATITSLIFSIVIAKRANRIINDIKQRFGGGIYAAGYYGDKKQERSDATKTAFGFIGALISMLFLGVGFYRTRGGKVRRNFVITPTALYEVNGKKIEYTNLTPYVQVDFANAPVIEKGNKLTMTGADGRSYLQFIPEKGEKEKLAAALNVLFNTQDN